jgi:hypothetical protein
VDCRDDPACDEADTDTDTDADTDTDTDTDTTPDEETDCDDGRDDDRDGDTDCDDSDCADLCAECWDAEADDGLGYAVATGTGTGSDAEGSCGAAGIADSLIHWTAPSSGTFTFDTVGSEADTVMWVLADSCDGDELICDDDTFGSASQVGVTLSSGDEVIVGIDAAGAWVFSAWEGTCPEYSIGQELAVVGSTGSTGDTFSSECGSLKSSISLRWVAPSTGTWTFSTSGSDFDTILSLREADCTGTELTCDDDVGSSDLTSVATATLTEGDVVAIVIGGYEGAAGDYELSIY